MAAPVIDLDGLLGRHARLPIRRFAAAGAFLALDPALDPDDRDPDAATVLLPGAEVPPSAQAGDIVRVFIHLDSEERPIATTREPKLALGEVAFLTVTARTEIGAFVDWGLGKELLVPFAEQSRELAVGERQPIGLYLDRSRRLAGTMYVTDLFGDRRRVDRDEWIQGEAWRNDPDIGLFAILERRFVGLVPASEPTRCTAARPLGSGSPRPCPMASSCCRCGNTPIESSRATPPISWPC
jgi:hypothetical protein